VILWSFALPFVGATLVGMLLGRMLNGKIPSHLSVLLFGILSATIAMVMLVKTLVGL
jgi:uncharacterized membrane protein YfcA